MIGSYHIRVGDVLDELAKMDEQSVHCVVASPPYWGLRDYGVDGQIGLEPTPDAFIEKMVAVFRGVWRVLRDDGTCWMNLGDSYAQSTMMRKMICRASSWARNGETEAFDRPCRKGVADEGRAMNHGIKPKDLCGIPWRVALALQADGWYLRSDIIWAKPNPMPESVTDRPTKAHEYLFLLTKKGKYYYDAYADRDVETNGSNLKSVWHIPTQAYSQAHFATYPEKLVEPCVKAGTSEKGCCPACGAGWVRELERDRKPTRPARDNCRDETGMANRDYERHVTETKTVGWSPQCRCLHNNDPDDPVQRIDYVPGPCTVLDPFCGSGTTGVVACGLGRDFIGIEINPEYAGLARKRIGKALQPTTYRDYDSDEAAPLFQASD